MGTGFDVSIPTEQLGIVPRAVDYMFSVMQNRHQEHIDQNRTPPLFDVLVQFIEVNMVIVNVSSFPSFLVQLQLTIFLQLYQDELVDLLDRATRSARGKVSGEIILLSCQRVGKRYCCFCFLQRGKPPRLGEDKNGNVILHNVCKKAVSSREDVSTVAQPNSGMYNSSESQAIMVFDVADYGVVEAGRLG